MRTTKKISISLEKKKKGGENARKTVKAGDCVLLLLYKTFAVKNSVLRI